MHSSSRPWPRSNDLSAATETDARCAFVLAIPACVSILIDVPSLARSHSLGRVSLCLLCQLLRRFPLFLSLSFTLHLSLKQRFSYSSSCFRPLLASYTSGIFSCVLICRRIMLRRVSARSGLIWGRFVDWDTIGLILRSLRTGVCYWVWQWT
jgi:hypothetical protein